MSSRAVFEEVSLLHAEVWRLVRRGDVSWPESVRETQRMEVFGSPAMILEQRDQCRAIIAEHDRQMVLRVASTEQLEAFQRQGVGE